MYSFEKDFCTDETAGRLTASMLSFMNETREYKPKLGFNPEMSSKDFLNWQQDVKKKARELLCLPEITTIEEPKRINVVQREGYRVERWEFYPGRFTKVPFLMLVPDSATKNHPAPAVLCYPGSFYSKEFIAGEPLLEPENCRFERYPERNKMALEIVKNGMIAFAFDPLEIAERGLLTDQKLYVGFSRPHYCYGLLQMGLNYTGISVYEQLCFLPFIKTLDYLDTGRVAVCAHSLGTQTALFMALLCDEIKAIVFNDYVGDDRKRYASLTEFDESKMPHDSGNWHIVPGIWQWFSYADLLAAIAPKPVAMDEGGADEFIGKVKKSFEINNADGNCQVSYYPKYRNEDSRSYHSKLPTHGLSENTFFEYSYVDAPDHSFRADPCISFLKKHFNI